MDVKIISVAPFPNQHNPAFDEAMFAYQRDAEAYFHEHAEWADRRYSFARELETWNNSDPATRGDAPVEPDDPEPQEPVRPDVSETRDALKFVVATGDFATYETAIRDWEATPEADRGDPPAEPRNGYPSVTFFVPANATEEEVREAMRVAVEQATPQHYFAPGDTLTL